MFFFKFPVVYVSAWNWENRMISDKDVTKINKGDVF